MTLPAPYYQDECVTLYHGDSTKIFPHLTQLAHVLITDPPYGQSYRGACRPTAPHLVEKWNATQVSCAEWDGNTDARDTILEQWADQPALVFGTWKSPRPESIGALIIWHKINTGYGPAPGGPWANTHEEIYVHQPTAFIGSREGSVIGYQPPPPNNRNHPTEKPLGLMRYLIERCPPEWVIIDPFAGSGSTLRAAKDLGRTCIGIELDERWLEVAARRCAQDVLDLGAAL